MRAWSSASGRRKPPAPYAPAAASVGSSAAPPSPSPLALGDGKWGGCAGFLGDQRQYWYVVEVGCVHRIKWRWEEKLRSGLN